MYCVLHTYKRSMITSRKPKTASRRSHPVLHCSVSVAPAAMHHHHHPSLRLRPECPERSTVGLEEDEAPLESSTAAEALAESSEAEALSTVAEKPLESSERSTAVEALEAPSKPEEAQLTGIEAAARQGDTAPAGAVKGRKSAEKGRKSTEEAPTAWATRDRWGKRRTAGRERRRWGRDRAGSAEKMAW